MKCEEGTGGAKARPGNGGDGATRKLRRQGRMGGIMIGRKTTREGKKGKGRMSTRRNDIKMIEREREGEREEWGKGGSRRI
mmetsp:Transcript_23606/g.32975  ORF Transcript_23606/g.32975 Transcript_23606/m.32975 type:complete len:81 (-) Transcript_23606:131-373(-)